MRVALFTRWPEAGKAKTRLIPALGPQGAADLHRRLTERTVATVKAAGLALEIRSTGADPARFRDWLGVESVVDQGEGDLGDRLSRTAETLPVLLLGADIPGLLPQHLRAAAAALATAPAVIGPAADGGYWLLGLAEPMPQLFTDMAWGTDAVLAATLARLPPGTPRLETLSDLDTPEDLARWPGL
ncbi:TIGR04282 family arsenosugar biosynthesis glycosyltransferase [Sandarakinorhabdus sp.]|uniref:TIGR04282 family arsenosugar biosynthesis glycosyltransferase n=1 Tax=Sandarakinorhabdus sp. TaxID=1916663 RepID=UPI00286E4EC9|nr:TIGR04282 family arsenosugar biosynthesis glycosyltransferase [Sandarakinorhabdus sp.]